MPNKKNLMFIMLALVIGILVIILNKTDENSIKKNEEETSNVFRRAFEDGKRGLRNVAAGINNAIYNHHAK